VRREGWNDLALLPFFSMVDRRRTLHRELIVQARAEFPAMLATEVPYWSEIERMSVRRAPLPACAPSSDAARIYRALWSEIRERLEALPRPATATRELGRYPASDDPGAGLPRGATLNPDTW
jgi:nitrogenase subunit NifH